MIGQILGGRYQLVERIGEGGMAMVYRATDLRTQHDVAVKVMHEKYASDPQYVNRFQREAQAAARMTHHNIVNLLDVGMEGDVRYLVMEYVPGPTLKQFIASRGKLDPRMAVGITIRILSALEHAHGKGSQYARDTQCPVVPCYDKTKRKGGNAYYMHHTHRKTSYEQEPQALRTGCDHGAYIFI